MCVCVFSSDLLEIPQRVQVTQEVAVFGDSVGFFTSCFTGGGLCNAVLRFHLVERVRWSIDWLRELIGRGSKLSLLWKCSLWWLKVEPLQSGL